MSAILRLLNTTENSTELNVKQVLDTPAEYEDIVTVTDRLIHSLEDAIWSAREVVRLLNQAVR
ncbi:hypothetical protein D3C72_2461750 [compost metagenome]